MDTPAPVDAGLTTSSARSDDAPAAAGELSSVAPAAVAVPVAASPAPALAPSTTAAAPDSSEGKNGANAAAAGATDMGKVEEQPEPAVPADADAAVKPEYVMTAEQVAAMKERVLKEERKGRVGGHGRGGGNNGGKRSIQDRGVVKNLRLLCRDMALDPNGKCTHGDRCKYTYHNIAEYMAAKLPDIGPRCHFFDSTGVCPHGFNCRYGDSHIDRDTMTLIVKPKEERKTLPELLNTLPNFMMYQLKKNQYPFKRAPVWVSKKQGRRNRRGKKRKAAEAANAPDAAAAVAAEPTGTTATGAEAPAVGAGAGAGAGAGSDAAPASGSTDAAAAAVPAADPVVPSTADDVAPTGDDVPMRAVERKRVDFKQKVYIAPLTTVGNLPFRRICKDMGADITCGEMAITTSILKGQAAECSLLKRHPCEDVFGVQIAGAFPDTVARTCELIDDHMQVDFVDLNMGCPLDHVCRRGMGAGLMRRVGRVKGIIKEATKVLGCEFTMKMRVGQSWKAPVAPSFINGAREVGGVSAIGIHGRSAHQRYTREADWNYLGSCVEAAQSVLYNDDGVEAPPVPIIGNGDVLRYPEFYDHIRDTGVTTCMIGRGVLIKPWLPTEIKERRDWDISSKERFEILQSFVKYGLEHWGSDDHGVNNTRRFLLEWLSFLHRYIPIGLLERPQHLNHRPPAYVGRDDLETLMASPLAVDWVKLSEMLLGPVPEGFRFVPKHKANSYAAMAKASALQQA